jgi:hypothetical protein
MKRFIEPLSTMKDHARMDRLVQGDWIDSVGKDGVFRGCFFGCAAQSKYNPIEIVCTEWGMPLWLGHLSEAIFEGLSHTDAKLFPVQLLEKLVLLDESFDFERARHDLAILRLTKFLDENTGDIKSAINGVIEYHKNPSESLRLEVEGAALKAAESVVDIHAYWSAAYAAICAKNSVGKRCRSSVRSAIAAIESATWWDDIPLKSTYWEIERDNLFSVLGEGNE